MMDRAQRIKEIQEAIAEGRRRYYDAERRSTYPANPDEDTVALAEHYRLTYARARILKALSYHVDVTPEELTAVSGIHRALLTIEIRKIAERTNLRFESERKRDNTVLFYRLASRGCRDELRAVIQGSWLFSETFMPQSRGKKAA
jgi:DNA-binding MarR family transcriptional regulator